MSALKKYHQVGILWFLLSLVCSNLNDITAKLVVTDLPVLEVAFFRFLFGTLSLLPLLLLNGIAAFRTPRLGMHFIRGSLLFAAMTLWTYGISVVPLTVVTSLSFTTPIFILILAPILLKEKVTKPLWGATFIGFIGALVVLNPAGFDFNPISLVLLISSCLFALLDVINKKYVLRETMLSMLFYSALVTATLALPMALRVWVTPSMQQLLVMMVLGVGSNLILYCLLKAFALINASALAPFRYTELLISAFMGYALFQEVPILSLYAGSALIIPATLFISYQQARSAKSQ